jgi:hypothetical protein
VIVLGDQLNGHSAAFDGFDPARDAILQTNRAENFRIIQAVSTASTWP